MSFLVLHMQKFKKEALRGLQSHTQRERKSHTNPDIHYDQSHENYDLHPQNRKSFSSIVQERIDALSLKKAVRSDAVHMCGLLISSDKEFFAELSAEETRRFFTESKNFLARFVGEENIISATVHMDESTPHMHFLHVPITGGKLSAKQIYTHESLKRLQSELPQYLQSKGFTIERGVEQIPGSVKKHLNTSEFKQQMEALHQLNSQVKDAKEKIMLLEKQSKDTQRQLNQYQELAENAENQIRQEQPIPTPNIFQYKKVIELLQKKIQTYKEALSDKIILKDKNKRLSESNLTLQQQLARERQQFARTRTKLTSRYEEVLQENTRLKNFQSDAETFLNRSPFTLMEFSRFRQDQEATRRLQELATRKAHRRLSR